MAAINPPDSWHHRTGWQLLILLVLVGGVYLNSLDGAFHYDDEHSIVRNTSLADLSQIPRYFVDMSAFSGDAGKGMYRPTLLVSYAVNHALHGYDVVGYHLVNVLLHAICVVLVWRLGRLLSPAQASQAWMAAALFAVHPVAAEPVNYISSRSETLMASFFLLTLLLHLRRSRGAIYRWGACLSFGLALLSKETGIVLIPILLLLDLWFGPANRRTVDDRNLAKRVRADRSVQVICSQHGIYWVIAVAYLGMLVWTGFLGGSVGEPVSAPLRSALAQMLTQLKAPVYYLQLLVLPSVLNVDHAFQVTEHVTTTVVLATALLMSLIALLIRSAHRWGHVALSALISLLVLLPTSVIPLNILVNERRIYLVLAAICLSIPRLIDLRVRPATIAALALLASLTVQRNEVWASPLSLWEDAMDRGSQSYTAFVNLGKARQGIGDGSGAASAYRQALTIEDGHGDVYNNLAVLMHEDGRLADAITYYQMALERSPQLEEIHHNLAVAYQETGDLSAASSAFRRALELEPHNGSLWSNFGQFQLEVSDLAGAESAYLEAVRLLGERAEPLNGLGNTLSALRRPIEAVTAYERALAVAADPAQRAVILTNLGESLMQAQRPEQARQALLASLAIAPSAAAHDYLARLSMADSDTTQAWQSWQASITLDPDRRVPLTGLGEISATRGDPDAARAWFERAVAAGAGRRAQEGLRRLKTSGQRGEG